MNVKSSCFMIVLFLLCFSNNLLARQLIVYNTIPGRGPSDQYICRLRQVGRSTWQDAFVLQTICKHNSKDDPGGSDNGYFQHLDGWSASWISFEFEATAVEVEIAKANGGSIQKAMVRPVASAHAATIKDGKAYITIDNPANLNVDINGQMEDRYTGHGYKGPPVHTISIFANPIIPVPTAGPGVVVLQPGEDIQALNRNAWHTIIFAPGIHEIGTPFEIRSNEVLYIPGDAIVKGTIHPISYVSELWTVYGSGTLSTEDIAWQTGARYNKPFTNATQGAHLEGFVVADPPHHTFNMWHSGDATKKNIYKNLKVFGWRKNGDGINAFRNSQISGCFFRVQDDTFYYGANVQIHDNVVWNDANGAVLFLTKGHPASYFRDITVIYHRAFWHYWGGGRVISMRDTTPGGNDIVDVLIQNVLVEDPYPAFAPFFGTVGEGSGSLNMENIVIENVHQEHPAVGKINSSFGNQPVNTLIGLDNERRFKNITFKNCYYNGQWLGSLEHGDFLHQYVDKSSVQFVVDGKTPEIAITSSENGVNFAPPAHFTATVLASDPDNNLNRVQLYVNDKLEYSTGNTVFDYPLSNLPQGTYKIEARATDTEGFTRSDVVTITVYNPDVFPWVEAFDLPDGTRSDGFPTSWTASRATGSFEVNAERLMINGGDNSSLGEFQTAAINISGEKVSISIDVLGEGGLDPQGSSSEDYFALLMKVDGVEHLIYENYGTQAAKTITRKGITGESLEIVIIGYVSSGAEYYYFDNIRVTHDG
ncbi:Ig-like domain-containing protein [Planctomycetota bacterium]